MADTPKVFQSNDKNVAAIVGENLKNGDGVFGIWIGSTGRGVVGTSEGQNGVTGISSSRNGGAGVWGVGENGNGVFGETKARGGAGVLGQNLHGGRAIFGQAGHPGTNNGGDAVFGAATEGGRGVVGTSDSGTGVWATSESGEGIHAETNSIGVAAIAGFNNNPNGTGSAIYGKKIGNLGTAGFFDGKVEITNDLAVAGGITVQGNITVQGDIFVPGADCAEDFDMRTGACQEPGTVMVIDDAGALTESSCPYDRRVAGVISGAGAYRPGVIFDRSEQNDGRKPIALVGKVFCKADASHGPIDVGDLLTTSPTLGHAMKAQDPAKAFGAVIGKAMKRLAEGRGLIPILIALQ